MRCRDRGRGLPNYPGVTIDRRSATVDLPGGRSIELTDLPGTYSLSARSREEQIAVESLLGRGPRRPDAILVVADATALARAPLPDARDSRDRPPRRHRAQHDGRSPSRRHHHRRRAARAVDRRPCRADGRQQGHRHRRRADGADRRRPGKNAPRLPDVTRSPALLVDMAELEGLILFRAPHGPAARCPGVGAVAAAVAGPRRRRRAGRHSALGPCRRQPHPSARRRSRPQHRPRDHQRTLSARRSPDGRGVPARQRPRRGAGPTASMPC